MPETNQPDQAAGDAVVIGTEAVEVHTAINATKTVHIPREIECEGRDAIHAFVTQQETEAAEREAKRLGLSIPKEARTGHRGALLMSDVQRAEKNKPAPTKQTPPSGGVNDGIS